MIVILIIEQGGKEIEKIEKTTMSPHIEVLILSSSASRGWISQFLQQHRDEEEV